ncbi:DUF1194 domain-containing protein [Pseudoroseicyclus tamaricis]|uniref:DUF1194 domain-containing protein n=1 Tax=Pseudoroseicyclus tamaricis TaxID=2705421 RepID=A0A6B2JUR2_9RHOB|nr:DUF1194 domain-containing protein [Pseudoroseicyclus tamaricis]NDV01645.1 DUF1194 domain-containing protein [Pseudoroseicyclus tamaricis]
MIRRPAPLACLLASLLVRPALACDTALVLAIDVSNSVDAAEYRLQVDGMADALADPEILQAAVDGQVAIAVLQWSGVGRQEVSIPWRRIGVAADALALSAEARALPRAFTLSDTAPAEAVMAGLALFGEVPDCRRRIIDVSGDGTPNAGGSVPAARTAAEQAGVTINGLAIESLGRGQPITSFFARRLVTGDGFVITARGHRDYPEAIRRKILREISRVFG